LRHGLSGADGCVTSGVSAAERGVGSGASAGNCDRIAADSLRAESRSASAYSPSGSPCRLTRGAPRSSWSACRLPGLAFTPSTAAQLVDHATLPGSAPARRLRHGLRPALLPAERFPVGARCVVCHFAAENLPVLGQVSSAPVRPSGEGCAFAGAVDMHLDAVEERDGPHRPGRAADGLTRGAPGVEVPRERLDALGRGTVAEMRSRAGHARTSARPTVAGAAGGGGGG
jgi:hypothetical protein